MDLACPKVARIVPLWDYLFLRAEGEASDSKTQRGQEPPLLQRIMEEYLALSRRFRSLVTAHLETVEGSSEAKEVLAGKPAPASVKRRRLKRAREIGESRG